MPRLGAVALVVSLAGLLAQPPRVLAGPVEQLVQVALHPSDPNVILLRYVYGGDGLLLTRDGGKSWQLACASMFLDAQTHSGPTLIAGDGSLWMAVFDALLHGDAHGCGFQHESRYDGEWFGDLTHHPSDPNVVFAVTSTASPMGEHKLNGVLRRDARGEWSDFGTKEEMLAARLHVVTHGSGLRMYVTAVKGQIPTDGGLQPNYAVRVSDDDGATWQEFALGAVDGTFRVQGVDPRNPDRIVATINRPNDAQDGISDDSVLVSSDRGEHFVEYMKVAEIGGVAFAPDGRVWIADAGDTTRPLQAPGGLWFASSLDSAATRLPMASYPVQCLGYAGATDTLYACQRFAFGTVDESDGAFSPLVKFTRVTDFVQCDGVDSAAACEMQLCGAYCGFGHFAVAPMCEAYDTPNCGKPVAEIERGYVSVDAGTADGAGVGTGGATAIGQTLTTDAGLRGSGATGASGEQFPGAPAPRARHREGACSLSVSGARGARTPLAASGLLLLAALASRNARRRRGSAASHCAQISGCTCASSRPS
jgi:hypothetical protein